MGLGWEPVSKRLEEKKAGVRGPGAKQTAPIAHLPSLSKTVKANRCPHPNVLSCPHLQLLLQSRGKSQLSRAGGAPGRSGGAVTLASHYSLPPLAKCFSASS
jgi:hypothetical protein